MQRSASFNASSTVPLKITILDDVSSNHSGSSSYCVKNSKSLSNCSLISKIVFKGDGTRNIISHLVPSAAAPNPLVVLPIDGGGKSAARDPDVCVPKVPTIVSIHKASSVVGDGGGVDQYRDYYV